MTRKLHHHAAGSLHLAWLGNHPYRARVVLLGDGLRDALDVKVSE